MKFAMVVPFVLIAAAPLVGRWRANVWLKKHVQQRQPRTVAARVVKAT